MSNKGNLVKYQGVDKNGQKYTRWVSPEEFKSLNQAHGETHEANKNPEAKSEESKSDSGHSEGQLVDLAKEASDSQLEKTISESKDEKVVETAKKELEKRNEGQGDKEDKQEKPADKKDNEVGDQEKKDTEPKKETQKPEENKTTDTKKETSGKPVDANGKPIEKNGLKLTQGKDGNNFFKPTGKSFLDKINDFIEDKQFKKNYPELHELSDPKIHIDEFYSKMDKILKDNDDFLQKNKDNPSKKIKEKLENDNMAFNKVLSGRVGAQLGIKLGGGFPNGSTLGAVKSVEALKSVLPQGHLVSNPNFKRFAGIFKDQNPQKFYAAYTVDYGSITVSDELLENSDISGVDIKNKEEWDQVIVHELGHSIEYGLTVRLGEEKGMAMKDEFAQTLGWSKFARATMGATVHREDESVKIFSWYASSSPSEAFAEYYSLYSLNKDKIDKFLDGGEAPNDISYRDANMELKKITPRPITSQEIADSKVTLEWMRKNLFENPQIAKSDFENGLIDEDAYLDILMKSHVNYSN